MARLYYFVGGPHPGKEKEFFGRLAAAGGSPAGWRIYPHASNDGKALHIANVNSPEEITRHLAKFSDVYEHGEIIEIIERK
jgi:hypothetical protein